MICKMPIGFGCKAYIDEVAIVRRSKINVSTLAMSDTIRCHIQGEHAHAQARDEEDENSIENRLLLVERSVYDQSI